MIRANEFPSRPCHSKGCPARKPSILKKGLGPLIMNGNDKYHLLCLPDRGLTKGDTIK